MANPTTAALYDQDYFDGGPHAGQPGHSIGGYSEYVRFPIDYAEELDPTKKEFFSREAKIIFDRFDLRNKRVLDLGCGKGFHVKSLRDFGANAFGVDFSPYAVSKVEPEARDFVILQDVLTYVASQSNQSWDMVLNLRLLPCLPSESLAAFLTNVRRITRKAYFTVDSIHSPSNFYNVQPPAIWTAMINNPSFVVEEYYSTQHI